jgi:hypothetical protein
VSSRRFARVVTKVNALVEAHNTARVRLGRLEEALLHERTKDCNPARGAVGPGVRPGPVLSEVSSEHSSVATLSESSAATCSSAALSAITLTPGSSIDGRERGRPGQGHGPHPRRSVSVPPAGRHAAGAHQHTTLSTSATSSQLTDDGGDGWWGAGAPGSQAHLHHQHMYQAQPKQLPRPVYRHQGQNQSQSQGQSQMSKRPMQSRNHHGHGDDHGTRHASFPTPSFVRRLARPRSCPPPRPQSSAALPERGRAFACRRCDYCDYFAESVTEARNAAKLAQQVQHAEQLHRAAQSTVPWLDEVESTVESTVESVLESLAESFGSASLTGESSSGSATRSSSVLSSELMHTFEVV